MAKRRIIFLVCAALLLAQYAAAGTMGHYYPGVMGMRDIVLPPEGFYALYYNPIYYSNVLTNANGNSLKNFSMAESETKHINLYGHDLPIKLSAGLTADVNASMSFTNEQILIVWTPGWKFLGADYGMTIAPAMGYVSVDVEAKARAAGTIAIDHISRTVVRDDTVKVSSEKYGFTDLLVMPVMLDWRGKNYDVGFNYGFFAPTGAYDEDRLANVGMGFWTQQFQMFGAYYFDERRARALIVTGTYNLNSSKYDQDVTPGQSMTLEYALSQYLSERVEVGICGYDQWQISPDTGSAARNKDIFYQIHGIGFQAGGWVIKNKLNVTTKCTAEYYGADHFRGVLGTVNVIWVF